MNFTHLWEPVGFPGDSVAKNTPANAGDSSSIPGSGWALGEGHGNTLQYSHLENPMDRGAWWAIVSPCAHKESDTTEQLHFHFQNELGVCQEAYNNNTIYTIITMIWLVFLLFVILTWLFLRLFILVCFQREVTTKPMTLIPSQRGLFIIICKKLQIFT